MNYGMDSSDKWKQGGYVGFNNGELNATIHKTGAEMKKTSLRGVNGIYKRKVDKELDKYYNDTMDRYARQKDPNATTREEKTMGGAKVSMFKKAFDDPTITSMDRHRLNRDKRFK